MIRIQASNSLLMMEEDYPDNFSGGCCWTSDLAQAATFVDEQEFERRACHRFPLVYQWVKSGKLKICSCLKIQ